MWRKYFEVDGLAIDALVAPCDSCSLVFDFPLDIAEVVEPPVGDVVELGPFISSRLIGVPVDRGPCILTIIARNVDELQDEGPSSNDTAASGEKISADNVLEHRRLAR